MQIGADVDYVLFRHLMFPIVLLFVVYYLNKVHHQHNLIYH